MNKISRIPGGNKLLALADSSGKKYMFIGVKEREKISAKMIYYLWLSRFFVVTSAASLLLFMAASLALFNLAPQVTVEPFLIIDQNSSDKIVRYEPISSNMASKNMMMETFVRQYVLYRNTVINDEFEMMVRWYAGGILNYLSAPNVFADFSKEREKVWKVLTDDQISREVEIISIGRVGGDKSPVWKVDFKTNEVSARNRNNETGALFLRSKYWTASVTSYFIPERVFMGRRLLNPLGFTVTRYSQSEVEFL